MKTKWNKVSDNKMPEEYEDVIGTSLIEGHQSGMEIVYWDSDQQKWLPSHDSIGYERIITHWCELPKPPQE